MDTQITNLFRSNMQRFNITASTHAYEYLDGELWYRGEPLTNRMTANEAICLEYATREALNELTVA